MAKILVKLPYSAAYLMSSKDFGVFADLIANATRVDINHAKIGDEYKQTLVYNDACGIHFEMTNDVPVCQYDYDQMLEANKS